MTTNQEDKLKLAKEAAGKAAASLIQEGMLVGLGTGSTTAYFIHHLGKRRQDGLDIRAVATSEYTRLQAEKENIPLVDPRFLSKVDLTVDGADEIDPKKRMIKGGGGALLKEKILAAASQEMVVIVDENKCVETLGKFPLPIEILPFCFESTLKKIRELGHSCHLRQREDDAPYITDNGNYIADIHFSALRKDPENDDHLLLSIPGVIGTGFFFALAGRVIVGTFDGKHKVLA